MVVQGTAAGPAPLEALDGAVPSIVDVASDPGREGAPPGKVAGPDACVAVQQPCRIYPGGSEGIVPSDGGDGAGLVEPAVQGDIGLAEGVDRDFVEGL